MNILVLAGTAEARELCHLLAAAGHNVTASLAGATRKPMPVGVPTRIGGFGGREGLQDFVQTHDIDVLIDATHPFAQRMSASAAAIKVRHHCILQRPEWTPSADDTWIDIETPAAAARHVKDGQIVFLATGRQTIVAFAGLGHAYVYARTIDQPTHPYPHNGEFLQGRPPFPIEHEIELFKRLEIDWLIVKNAGGPNSVSKLDAARALHIPVLMLKRPILPEAHVMSSVEETMDWVVRLGNG
ncbi:MAG: cobalt-precorrin-6A reductase [Pseudomonadota bacterium]